MTIIEEPYQRITLKKKTTSLKILLNFTTVSTNDAEMQKWWKTHLFSKILKDFSVGCDPRTVFDCAALESPDTVFKFPSQELSSALTCALGTSGLPGARGAGGPRLTAALNALSASTLQRWRFNIFPPRFTPFSAPNCSHKKKVRPCSTATRSCEWTVLGDLGDFFLLSVFVRACSFSRCVLVKDKRINQARQSW